MIDHTENWEKVQKVYGCDCRNKEVRYKLNEAKAKMFFLQCTRCGEAKRIARGKVTNPNSATIKLVDEELRQSWWKQKEAYRQKLYEESQNRERQEWFDWYNRYLLSPAWSKKRVAVLKRANFMCEGCQEKTAVQVHHLTYRRVGNEMLFDLVAVCHDCHRIIHDSENQMLVSKANGHSSPSGK